MMKKWTLILGIVFVTSIFGFIQSYGATIELSLPDTYAESGASITLPITVKGFSNVAIIELHISYDTEVLSYQSTSSNYLNEGDVNDIGGQLNIVWIYGGTPLSISDGNSLLVFNFAVVGNSGDVSNLAFVGNNNIGDPNENPFTLDLNNGKLTVSSSLTLSLNVSPPGSGTVSKNPDKTNFSLNESVELQANAKTGYQFDHWEGDLSGTANPKIITMQKSKTITACFTPSETPESVSPPNQPSGPSDGKVGQSLSFTSEGSNSSLGHDVEYQFDWGDGSQSSWGASTKSHTFSSTGTKYVKARARCQTHTDIVSDWSAVKTVTISYCVLTVNINPTGKGSVTKNPNKTNFTYNETVQLTANPISGYYLNSWDGALSGSSNPQTLTMSSDKSVTANFTQNQSQETVSTPNKPSGPSSGKVGQSLTFSTGGSSSNLGHTVEYQFDWGDGTQSSWGSETQSHAFSSSGNKYVKARARCQTHTSIVSGWSGTKSVALSYCNLVISSSPSGSGSVNIIPNKTNFSYNESVQLEAVANSGFTFDYWGGISGSVNPKNITMTQDKDVTAYFTPSSDVTCESNDIENIKSYRLNQNYPNPFNPETTISFQLPKLSYIKLAIYNLSGQLVETLLDGFHTAGEYNVKWRPEGLANGIYLYRLKADNYIETRKLILQK